MLLFFICRGEDEKNVSDKNVSISQSETLAKDQHSIQEDCTAVYWGEEDTDADGSL
jgi:hypothetical protein